MIFQTICYIALYLIETKAEELDPIYIKAVGLFNIERRDVGIMFYLTVKNRGQEMYHITTKMVECCESITNEDTDCEFMHLLGGNMGYLTPNKTRNMTLIFPNMYPHNRKGECDVSIWFKNKNNATNEVRHKIEFNTFISNEHVPAIMKNYFKPWELSVCQSPDQDPLDKCLPVNCHMKYCGCRSYYNPITQRCQRIPLCMSNPKKEMPDVAYDPMSNTCRDLETTITEEDVHFLTRSDIDTKWKVEPPPLITNMRCHHGHMDNETGICICDPGWSSTPFDRDQFNPSTVLYHMCTIQERPMVFNRLYNLVSTHFSTILLMNVLMSICLIIMIFYGQSFINNYEIASSKNKGKKYVPLCVLINFLIKLAVNVFIINFLIFKMEEQTY